MKPLSLFILGVLVFGGAQAIWSVAHLHELVRGTWMLKTGGGIATCFVLFVVVSAIACAWRSKGRSVGDCIVTLTESHRFSADSARSFLNTP